MDPDGGAMATGAGIGRLGERIEGVRRIAVLRAGGLGDLLFAVPAMQALAAAYPEAELTLLGSAVAEALLPGRHGGPDRVIRLPAVPGVGSPPGAPHDPARIESFVRELRRERFDLALQVHGGGRYSNPFLLALGARVTAGTRTPDAAPLDRSLSYVYYQHEVIRALEVAALAGAAPVALEPRLSVNEAERDAGARLRGDHPLVVVHPGATDPRRRWPIPRFAETIARLSRSGARVMLVGGPEDVATCSGIREAATRLEPRISESGVVDLSGRLDLSGLVAVLATADVVLGNDSGPRHLAQAVGTRTVSVFWFGNAMNAAPFGRGDHRLHLSWATHCPVCGRDCTQVGWTAERCEHDDSLVAEVPVDAVLADVIDLLGP